MSGTPVDDDEDDWMEVYNDPTVTTMTVQDDTGTTTFENYIYYNCWGGGPEGGYLIPYEGCDRTLPIIEINRGWHEPFKVTKKYSSNVTLIYREKNEMKGITRAIKFVDRQLLGSWE